MAASWVSMDDVIAGMVAGQNRPFYFPSITTVAGRYSDLTLGSGTSNRYGAVAAAANKSAGGGVPVDSDSGYPFFTNSGAGELRLAKLALAMQTPGTLLVFDKAWEAQGFVGNLNTAQTLTGFTAVNRPDANGTGLELWADITTLIGTTATTVTCSYTNSANTSGRTTQAAAIGGTGLREVNRAIPIPLQAGDTGVKSIASMTLLATTGTAGAINLMLLKRLATIPVGISYGPGMFDFAKLGLPLVSSDAALTFIYLAGTTTSGAIDGELLLGDH